MVGAPDIGAFEALPAVDAADVLVATMDWFGIQGAVQRLPVIDLIGHQNSISP